MPSLPAYPQCPWRPCEFVCMNAIHLYPPRVKHRGRLLCLTSYSVVVFLFFPFHLEIYDVWLILHRKALPFFIDNGLTALPNMSTKLPSGLHILAACYGASYSVLVREFLITSMVARWQNVSYTMTGWIFLYFYVYVLRHLMRFDV